MYEGSLCLKLEIIKMDNLSQTVSMHHLKYVYMYICSFFYITFWGFCVNESVRVAETVVAIFTNKYFLFKIVLAELVIIVPLNNHGFI